MLWFSENSDLVIGEPCSGSRRTVLWLSENCALVLEEPCSGSRRTVIWFSENPAILVQANPLIKRALDKYFKDLNQRGGGKWRMYHSDETRFYQTDDSKVTRRLLKEKSKLTFVGVLIKIFIVCLLRGGQEQYFFLSFRHSGLRDYWGIFPNIVP